MKDKFYWLSNKLPLVGVVVLLGTISLAAGLAVGGRSASLGLKEQVAAVVIPTVATQPSPTPAPPRKPLNLYFLRQGNLWGVGSETGPEKLVIDAANPILGFTHLSDGEEDYVAYLEHKAFSEEEYSPFLPSKLVLYHLGSAQSETLEATRYVQETPEENEMLGRQLVASPDGSKLAYDYKKAVFVYDLKTKKKTQHTTPTDVQNLAADTDGCSFSHSPLRWFSPDQILVTAGCYEAVAYRVLNLETAKMSDIIATNNIGGSRVEDVVGQDFLAIHYFPTFDYLPRKNTLNLVNAATKDETRLTEATRISEARYNPTGQKIYYLVGETTSYETGPFEVWETTPDGASFVRLTQNGSSILLKYDLSVYGKEGLLLYTQGFGSETGLVEQGRSSNASVHVIDLKAREDYIIKNAYHGRVW